MNNNIQLSEELQKSIDILGYNNLTEVQKLAIPNVLAKKDLIVKSETGSGKTAAFAIPLSDLIVWDEISPQALILVPTRELALQVKEEFFNISRFKRLKILDIFGKTPYGAQTRSLKQRTHVVVGTPGRVLDHILRGNLKTSKIEYLVLDEADEMLNMGFSEEISKILNHLPEKRQSLMFSATISDSILDISHNYMLDPEFIEIISTNNTMDRIEQVRYNTENLDKIKLLQDLLVAEKPDIATIFCNTRDEVDFVYRKLKSQNYSCDKIHGGMEQKDRTAIMNDFKEFKFRYLIATDVAARGIDVDNVSHVINYNVPDEIESYVHRIGRTGRKGLTGKAITFHNNYEEKYIRDIEAYTATKIDSLDINDLSISSEDIAEFKNKMTTLNDYSNPEKEELNKGILKLHINAGKKTKMRAGDIVGAICSIDGLSGDDIGIIDIIDVSSFVEILNNKGDMVLEALKTTEIKGRLRTVSIARR